MTESLTEEKIKEAARIIFMEKGYAAAGMRDIATKAGVNLSLVNYYYRSKKNIFQIIMLEKMHKIFGSIIPYMIDENTSLEEKIKHISTVYIDTISEDPNLPLFVFSELQKESGRTRHLIPYSKYGFYANVYCQTIQSGLSRYQSGSFHVEFSWHDHFSFHCRTYIFKNAERYFR